MMMIPLSALATTMRGGQLLDELGTGLVVDLDNASETDWSTAAEALRYERVVVPLLGVSTASISDVRADVLRQFTCTLAPAGPRGLCFDGDPALAIAGIDAFPHAATVLSTLLPITEALDVDSGLAAESLAYSLLQGSGEFLSWLECRGETARVVDDFEPLRLSRAGNALLIELFGPRRHNAFDSRMRDALIDALEIARLDDAVDSVLIRGLGPSFCSGGDLDEFGTASDPITAHRIRVARHAGRAVFENADRVEIHVHGACIGAGVEIAAFASRVIATPDAWFQLPELRMGLIPGAGGTVSIPSRIGRWLTAWMVLSGTRVDAPTALSWGLVDEVIDEPCR